MRLGTFGIDRIYTGDAQRLLKKLPDEHIDLVLTDPPFAINFHGRRQNYHRTAERVIDPYAEISQAEYLDFSRHWINHCFRVLKPQGSMYVFSGWTNLKDILIALDEAGFHTINHLIWRYQFGVFTKRRFVTSHYHILLVVKDKKKYKFNKLEHYPEDVISIKREYWTGEIKTPTKLPLCLVLKLLLYSTDRGELVLDPFMGSGTTAVAARLAGRHYLGFELQQEIIKIARRQVRGIKPLREKELLELIADSGQRAKSPLPRLANA